MAGMIGPHRPSGHLSVVIDQPGRPINLFQPIAAD